MVIHLSDVFKGTNLGSTEADDSSHGSRLHLGLLLATLPACTQLGTVLLIATSSTLAINAPRMLLTFVGIASVCVSALVLLLLQHKVVSNLKNISLGVVLVTNILAALFLLLVLFDADAKDSFLLLGIAFSGAGMPFLLLICASAYSSFSRNDIFSNSLVSFVIVDCFYVLSEVFGQLLLPTMILLFALGVVCCGILLVFSDSLHLDMGETSEDYKKENKEEKPKIKSLVLSVSCLGTLLFMFTKGAVNVAGTDPVGIWVSAFASLAVVALALCVYLHYQKRFKSSYAVFLLLDIGLPGLAVLAIFIKLIQLEFFSSTVFLYFMKAYFLILQVAFWVELIQFVFSNKQATAKCCGVVALCEVAAFGVGSLCSLLDNDNGVILGLVTALFLIIGVIAVGYNLILLEQSKEPDDPCELSELTEIYTQANANEVSKIISTEYALTPRESEVLLELTYGHSSSYIARVLYISDNTVRSHMKNIYKKLGVHSREELIELMRLKQKEQQG